MGYPIPDKMRTPTGCAFYLILFYSFQLDTASDYPAATHVSNRALSIFIAACGLAGLLLGGSFPSKRRSSEDQVCAGLLDQIGRKYRCGKRGNGYYQRVVIHPHPIAELIGRSRTLPMRYAPNGFDLHREPLMPDIKIV